MIEFIHSLRSALGSLPGEDAQFKMAPMARPRIKQAMRSSVDARQGAVLVYFFPRSEQWNVVLMKRPDYDGTHARQVSFPGGQLEGSETHAEAALREFKEETGVDCYADQVLGELTQLYIPPSNFHVQPFVAYSTEQPVFDPDPVEVDSIIELPVPMLLNEEIATEGLVTLSTGVTRKTPYYEVDDHVVWGATAMILSELKEILTRINA